MSSWSRIMMVCLLVLIVAHLMLDCAPRRAQAQGERPGRYAIVASHPGGSDQISLVNTVWVLDSVTGTVTAYTVGQSADGPYKMVKISAGPTMR